MDRKLEKRIRALNELPERELASERGIALLGELVQRCVEAQEDAAACRLQRKKHAAIRAFYGPAGIEAERSELYLRELEIRAAPISQRVGICRAWWEDSKAQYGAASYVTARLVAPLYLLCCEEAGEYEELRVLCEEIVSIFFDSEDAEDRRLVLLCRAYAHIHGETGDPAALTELCEQAAAAFGEGNETALLLRRTLALQIPADDADGRTRRIERLRVCLDTAERLLGIRHRITLQLGCDLVTGLALDGQLAEAERLAKTVEKRCAQASRSTELPNLDYALSVLSGKAGRQARAAHYAKCALRTELKRYGNGDASVRDRRVQSAAWAFLEQPGEDAYLALSEAISDKLESAFLSFLAAAEGDRLAMYAARRNQNPYQAYSILTLAHAETGALSQTAVLAFWENACNRKSFLSDCALIHHALRRNPDFSALLERLRAAKGDEDPSQTAALERQVLDDLRAFDFPAYCKQHPVKDVLCALGPGEALIDCFLTDSIEGKEYAAIAATRNAVRLVRLGTAGAVDSAAAALWASAKQNGTPSADAEKLEAMFHAAILDCEAFQTVWICPDGGLYQVPFDLVFRSDVRCLMSAKDLLRRGPGCGASWDAPRSVTAFAAPRFDLGDDRDAEQMRGSRLAPLPGTMLEAGMLGQLFGEATALYTGEAANAERFLAFPFSELVHIGTHATAADGGKLFFSGINDLRRGAQLPPQYGAGCVSTAEIAGLDFSATRLVVLSACETAAGSYEALLGLRSLRRAFQLAGAGSVIASLWEADDLSTAVLMRRFYLGYKETANPAAALAQAKASLRTATAAELLQQDLPVIGELLLAAGQIDVYRSFRDRLFRREPDKPVFSHPYYWAGFQIFD